MEIQKYINELQLLVELMFDKWTEEQKSGIKLDIEATVTYATKFISNLSRIWFDLSPELKPRFQKLVFPQGVYYDAKTKFRTSKLGYIYELIQKNEAVKSPFSEPVDLLSGFQN